MMFQTDTSSFGRVLVIFWHDLAAFVDGVLRLGVKGREENSWGKCDLVKREQESKT
jgi:hypothetical protein